MSDPESINPALPNASDDMVTRATRFFLVCIAGVVLGLLIMFLTGCEQPKPPLDNLIVQDQAGNYYLMKYRSEGHYKVFPLGTNVSWKLPQ